MVSSNEMRLLHRQYDIVGLDPKVFAVAPDPASPARYPLRVSLDRRRLIDADGKPFLIQGDTAWSLIANLEFNEALEYLDDRRAKGFNTIIVNLIEHHYSNDPPRDRQGREPFRKPSDMSAPNDAYFDAAERVLDECARRGICVVLAPAYLGYRHDRGPGIPLHADGWYDEIVATGVDGCRKYGEYVGRRFGRFPNIVWCIGGDWHPEATRQGLDAIAAGIQASGVIKLFTGHPHPEFSPVETFEGSTWLDLNVTYTYGVVHRALLDDWKRNPPWPFFLVESTYEGEHNASPLQIRRQAYWSVLCGGNGHCVGNHPIWLFGEGWQAALDLPASNAMTRWGAFFRDLPWHELVPDIGHRLVTGGLGEARGLDRVTAAQTADQRVAVAYLPVHRPIEVNLAEMAGPDVLIEWFEPVSGKILPGGTLRSTGNVIMTPPFPEDALLTLRSHTREHMPPPRGEIRRQSSQQAIPPTGA